MFTDNDYAIAKSLALNIYLPDNYGVDDDGASLDDELIRYECHEAGFHNFSIDYGVSKVVVIPENYNWVLKTPLKGKEYYSYDEEEEEDYISFEFYCNADAPDSSDYCWDELLRIQEAQQAGFGKLFPVTEFLCKNNDRRYYLQEKVHPANSGFKTNPSKESVTRARKMDAQFKYCSSEWRAAVIEYYGYDFWINFVNWDEKQCSRILTDMHHGNYGYRDDGSPVILDASGFDD